MNVHHKLLGTLSIEIIEKLKSMILKYHNNQVEKKISKNRIWWRNFKLSQDNNSHWYESSKKYRWKNLCSKSIL
jgi:hypothetical protein